MIISLIAAMARNRVIGKDGKLPWRIPEDLKRFKKLTTGHCVVMGRKTFDSIGKPLPNRTNIVITRDKSWRADGVVVAHSLDEALGLASGDEVFVIGGGEIYAAALPKASKLYLTLVEGQWEGDAFFPEYDAGRFREVAREKPAGDAACEFVEFQAQRN